MMQCTFFSRHKLLRLKLKEHNMHTQRGKGHRGEGARSPSSDLLRCTRGARRKGSGPSVARRTAVGVLLGDFRTARALEAVYRLVDACEGLSPKFLAQGRLPMQPTCCRPPISSRDRFLLKLPSFWSQIASSPRGLPILHAAVPNQYCCCWILR